MFPWCHTRHLNPLKIHTGITTTLDHKRIDFPVSKKYFNKVEVKNKICINVCCYESKLTYPVHISGQNFKNSMDFLMISDKIKSHYFYIKDFNKFICNKTKNKISKLLL